MTTWIQNRNISIAFKRSCPAHSRAQFRRWIRRKSKPDTISLYSRASAHCARILRGKNQAKKWSYFGRWLSQDDSKYIVDAILVATPVPARSLSLYISTIDAQKQYLMSFDYVFKWVGADAYHISMNRRAQLEHILPLKRFIFMSLSKLILIFSA